MRLLVVLSSLLVACGSSGDPASGAPIYADNCATCHGADGTGDDAAGFPSLVDEKPAVSRTVNLVTDGEGVMPAFGGTLSDQDIQDVAAYVDETFVNP